MEKKLLNQLMTALCAITLCFGLCRADVSVKYFMYNDDSGTQLDYYKLLGFSHVGMFVGGTALFSHASGAWVYNDGNYQTGRLAQDFRKLKRLAYQKGLKMVPILGTLSYRDDWVNLDNQLPEAQRSVSEYNSSYPAPSCTAFPCTREWPLEIVKEYNAHLNMICAAGPVGFNKGVDEIFNEDLKIIKNNWIKADGTPDPVGPDYINIGHDELGYSSICFIKTGRSRTRPESPAQLVAMEINARIKQIDAVFGPSIQVILYGDCLLPGGINAEMYGLCGDVNTGAGGILKFLDQTYKVMNRIVVMPWGYTNIDQSVTRLCDGRSFVYSKTNQVRFLKALGCRYIPAAGEEAGETESMLDITRRTCFEWVKASQLWPAGLVGFADLVWPPFPANFGALYAGYTGPLLAYWGWTYEEKSMQLPRNNPYGPRMWKNVDFIKSRKDLAWKEGTYYFSPP
jgi:hypothetical protein